MLGPDSIGMGDCHWTGKHSQYITNHQSQLSLPSFQDREIEYRPAELVTLYNLIWLRSIAF